MYSGEKITIAVDGYSSCGKSTLARDLARQLHYVFIDSGAMYRGITLFSLENNIIHNEEIDRRNLINSLEEIELIFKLNSETKLPELYMNGVNVAKEIRSKEVASMVSQIAAIKEVRQKLVSAQRFMGLHGGIVMDGRDIGSVVFPNAELKLFVTADIETRVQRRYLELKEQNIEITKEEVRDNLIQRDFIDTTRKESPLIQCEDAIVIDNSGLTREQQLEVALNLAKKTIAERSVMNSDIV